MVRWDWGTFGNSVVSASLAVMERLSKAGIQPITHAAGLALASQFRLGDEGRRHMDEALANLKSIPAFDKVLYFGFGIQSYVKLLGESQRGVNCIALCSSLSEVFSYPFTARTLNALWQVSGGPTEYEPSHTQFLALVKGCAGVLASSPFSAVAERMLGTQKLDTAKAPSPEQLAQVLDGLFKISLGNVESITVEGGPACAFIAGLAEWLFKFTVYVEDENHTMIHLSATEPSTAQVRVLYRASRSPDQRSITARSTYLLHRNEELFLYSDKEMMDSINFRVTWDQCLTRTFSATFIEEITARQEVVGHFFGSYARFLAGRAYPEFDSMQSPMTELLHLDGSSGYALLESVVRTFPELADMKHLRAAMLQGISQSVADASQSVRANLIALKNSCLCSSCADAAATEIRFCLPIAVFTIVEVARFLTSVKNDSGLGPTCRGMSTMYFACLNTLRTGLRKDDPLWAGRLDGSPGQTVTVLNVLEFFSTSYFVGVRWDLRRDETALANCGVCVYQESLRGISDLPEHLGVVNVHPGHIGHGAQQYDFLRDPPGTPEASSAAQHSTAQLFSTQGPCSSDESNCTVAQPLTESFVRHEKLKIKALFQEYPGGGAVFFYQLIDASTSFSTTIFPGAITELTLGESTLRVFKRSDTTELPFQRSLQIRHQWLGLSQRCFPRK